jgi:peptidoglycan/LPS O-acetylase OafA/YrhL
MKATKVQTLRGMACCMLLVYHIIGATPLQGLRVHDSWLRELTEALVAVRMPVFGLIAGAMYGYSSQRGWALIKNKAKRLLLPMLSVGSIFALLQYVTPGSNYHTQDLYLIHIVPVAHYWFLESLFLIFCLLAMAESLLPLNNAATWCVYFVGSLMLYLAHPGIIWFSVLGACYLLPYFLLGTAMTRLQWDRYQQRPHIGLLLTGTGAVLIVYLLLQGQELERFSPPVLLAGLLMSAGLWSLGWRNALLARIGDYSFAIFLFHSFFTSATRMALQKLVPDAQILVLFVSVPIGILLPIALQQLIHRSSGASAWLLGGKTSQVSP